MCLFITLDVQLGKECGQISIATFERQGCMGKPLCLEGPTMIQIQLEARFSPAAIIFAPLLDFGPDTACDRDDAYRLRTGIGDVRGMLIDPLLSLKRLYK
jgi:hypothetical protein